MHKPSAAMVVAALVLSACSTPPSDRAAAGDPASARGVDLDKTKGSTCFPIGNRKLRCHLFVGLVNNEPYVFPSTLTMARGRQNDPQVTLVWHLVDEGLVFTADDGPPEFKNHPEFSDGGPTADPDGEADLTREARRYRIKFRNKVATGADGYKYTMVFRNQMGRRFSLDPRIANQGD